MRLQLFCVDNLIYDRDLIALFVTFYLDLSYVVVTSKFYLALRPRD